MVNSFDMCINTILSYVDNVSSNLGYPFSPIIYHLYLPCSFTFHKQSVQQVDIHTEERDKCTGTSQDNVNVKKFDQNTKR